MLIVYARFVGNGASVDRATLMAVVYFGARAFDQRSPPLNALALVAALLVASDPLSVVDPAFVLTFGATLAILAIVPVMTARNAERDGRAETTSYSAASAVSRLIVVISRPLAAIFAASAAAEAMLFPVGALAFSRVTFAGLGLNFLAIPLMGVAQIAGMAAVAAAIVSPRLAAVAGWAAHLGAAGLVRSADLVGLAPALTYLHLLAAAIEDGQEPRRANFVLRADTPGIRVEETWDNFGMRSTASHDLILENVEIPADRIVPDSKSNLPGEGRDRHDPRQQCRRRVRVRAHHLTCRRRTGKALRRCTSRVGDDHRQSARRARVADRD